MSPCPRAPWLRVSSLHAKLLIQSFGFQDNGQLIGRLRIVIIDDLEAAAERILALPMMEGDLDGEQVQLDAQGLEITSVAFRRPGVQSLQGFVDPSR